MKFVWDGDLWNSLYKSKPWRLSFSKSFLDSKEKKKSNQSPLQVGEGEEGTAEKDYVTSSLWVFAWGLTVNIFSKNIN